MQMTMHADRVVVYALVCRNHCYYPVNWIFFLIPPPGHDNVQDEPYWFDVFVIGSLSKE